VAGSRIARPALSPHGPPPAGEAIASLADLASPFVNPLSLDYAPFHPRWDALRAYSASRAHRPAFDDNGLYEA
jgi:hypothetical protein